MRVTGIIAEYNPFHNGHNYQLNKAKTITGADYLIVVMSGSFVQRGEPAIYDKYYRANMALACGADLVLELPAVFATSSAQDFASCSVSLLNRLGITDFLCFGSELGQSQSLMEIAAALLQMEKNSTFTKLLQAGLQKGLTYPQARLQAFSRLSYLDSSILNAPNNILGVEYCRAILMSQSSIKPVTIKRKGKGYHDSGLDSSFSSASAIRREIFTPSSSHTDIKNQIPEPCQKIMKKLHPLSANHFNGLLNYAILTCIHQGIPLSEFEDLSEETANRLLQKRLEFSTWEDRITQLKTRQYTYTRISRALLHLMLGIRKEDVAAFRSDGYCPYARILGFRKSAVPLLSAIKANSSIPLITKTAGAKLSLSKQAAAMLSKDIYCTHIYQSVFYQAYGILPKNELNRPITII